MRVSVDLSSSVENMDLIARFRTSLPSGASFFTDLNGLQTIKRDTHSKLPLAANYFPITSLAFLQAGRPSGGGSESRGDGSSSSSRSSSRSSHGDNRGRGSCRRFSVHMRQAAGVASLQVKNYGGGRFRLLHTL